VIIGEYVVNPLEVVYGYRTWDARIPFYEVSIQLRTEVGIVSLSQRDVSEKVTKGWLKQIEKCIEERKEAILDGVFDDGGYDEEELS
jgi:hypothetical protein